MPCGAAGSGEMLTGWQRVGAAWYYLDDSGAMATGCKQIGGKWHDFNSSGVWLGETYLVSGSNWSIEWPAYWRNKVDVEHNSRYG